jgi:hypothetical protein
LNKLISAKSVHRSSQERADNPSIYKPVHKIFAASDETTVSSSDMPRLTLSMQVYKKACLDRVQATTGAKLT